RPIGVPYRNRRDGRTPGRQQAHAGTARAYAQRLQPVRIEQAEEDQESGGAREPREPLRTCVAERVVGKRRPTRRRTGGRVPTAVRQARVTDPARVQRSHWLSPRGTCRLKIRGPSAGPACW